MLHLNQKKIWELIEKNIVEINVKSYGYLTCFLCKNIMRNACETECGCTFCLSCINEYITVKKSLYCPGNKEKCKDNKLNIDENIHINDFLNYIITKIVVKCPENSCEFQGKLKKIPKHLKICKHYNRDHIESSDSFKTKPIFVENTFDSSITYKFKGFDENINNEIRVIKSEIENLKFINKSLTEEIEFLKNKIMIDSKIEKDSLVNYDKFSLDNNYKNINKSKLIKCLGEIEKYEKFLWKIEQFSDKRRKARFLFNIELNSDYFYTHENGYKLRISAYPNGFGDGSNSHLSVVFRVIKGPHDNELIWPMKLLINIGLIDQDTGNVHCSKTYDYATTNDNLKYVFNKPKTIENRSFGSSKFISLDKLISNPVLCKNDRIILLCTINTNE